MEIPTEILLAIVGALTTAGGGVVAWFKKRLDTVEKELAKVSEQNAELREQNAKLEITIRLLSSHGRKSKEIESILNGDK